MRRPTTPRNGKDGRHLLNFETSQYTPNHHFAREFHSRGLQSKIAHRISSKPPHSAVKITDGSIEKQSAKKGKKRIAHITVKPRHSPWGNPAPEPIAHHQIRAQTKLGNEWH